jgi:hypothetical protein
MTLREQRPLFAPSPQGIAMIRERLERMGLPVTEAAVTAESVLTSLKEERSVPPVPAAIVNDRRPVTPRRPPELPGVLDEDEPRPVFKRPRR